MVVAAPRVNRELFNNNLLSYCVLKVAEDHFYVSYVFIVHSFAFYKEIVPFLIHVGHMVR